MAEWRSIKKQRRIDAKIQKAQERKLKPTSKNMVAIAKPVTYKIISVTVVDCEYPGFR